MPGISSPLPEASGRDGSLRATTRSTIRDVARVAGVSVSTVSHALSGKRPVRASTVRRVVEAVEELGYQPDPVAQAMITGHSWTLGLILPDIVNPFFPQVVRGAEDAAAEAGYSLILGNTDLRPDRELAYVEALTARRVSGILFMPGDPEADRALRRLRAAGVPHVLLDESLEGPDGAGVFSDNAGGGYMAARHLIDVGRRRLVYLGGPAGLPTVQERERGFRKAVVEAGLTPVASRYGPYRVEAGYDATRDLLDAGLAFDGVFAGDDLLALGAIQALAGRGRHVPDAVAVCGFDGIAGTELWTPSLTTIVQASYELGAAGARLLLAHLRDEPHVEPRVVLPVKLVVRSSTIAASTTGAAA
jgi:LacI family transcriptional regulator